jgi:hypothetical protein
MPASADKALEGLLAEGIDAEAVLDAMKTAGFGITPPKGDDSYGAPEGEGGGIGLLIAAADGEAPEAEEPGAEDEKPEAEGGDQKPLSLFRRREKAARSAMKKHGYPTESDDEDE